MGVIASLAAEHDIFRGLIERVERAARRRDEEARGRLRAALLVLLPALDRHEELEDQIFGAGPLDVVVLVRRQHERVHALRELAGGALEEVAGQDGAALREHALRLAAALKRHLETEEKELWPRFAGPQGRRFARALEGRARRGVERLAREVARYESQVSEYLEA